MRCRVIWACSFVWVCAVVCRADEYGQRRLTDAETQVVATASAWSTITSLADGSLGLVYQLALPLDEVDSCHVAMQWIRSTDNGRTWSEPVLVSARRGPGCRLAAPRDGDGHVVYQQRNQSLGQLPNGRIFCAFCELDYHFDADGKAINKPGKNYNHHNQGVAYTWSDDLGKTWVPSRRMNSDPVGGSDGVAPHWGVVALADGTVLMPLYGAFNPDYR